MDVRLVAWDFDGVLNRDVENGEIIWHRHFERDLGVPLDGFRDYVFRSGRFQTVLTGRVALPDLIDAWIAEMGHDLSQDTLLEYWFSRSDTPDTGMTELMQAVPHRQIMATNNEALRTAHIRHASGWGKRVAAIFSSGEMGVAKPDAGFYAQIEDWAGVAPGEILLVDDSAGNIEAAEARGWQVFHFTDATRDALPGHLGL